MLSVPLHIIIGDKSGMKVVHSIEGLSLSSPNIVFAAGFFDGVHRGHQHILKTAQAVAHASSAQIWVLTFDPHPLAVLAPNRCPALLTSLELRLALLEQHGIDGVVILPFTRAFAQCTAQEFVQSTFSGWLAKGCSCQVVSGKDWRFGSDQQGAIHAIESLTHGCIKTTAVDLLIEGDSRISSSRIRADIQQDKLEDAAQLLGRPHWIRERTKRGRGLGAQIGFPTANMMPTAEVLPTRGVYEVDVCVSSLAPGIWKKGVANLGVCPTVNTTGFQAKLEVHILGQYGELYGEQLDIHFIRKLRDEVKFESIDALIKQITADCNSISTTIP